MVGESSSGVFDCVRILRVITFHPRQPVDRGFRECVSNDRGRRWKDEFQPGAYDTRRSRCLERRRIELPAETTNGMRDTEVHIPWSYVWRRAGEGRGRLSKADVLIFRNILTDTFDASSRIFFMVGFSESFERGWAL